MSIAIEGAARPTPVREIPRLLGIPLEKVQLFMVNHRAVPLDFPVSSGDRVAVFPEEYKIFWDWHGFRNKGKG